MFKPTLEQQIRANIPTLDYTIGDDFIGVFDGVFPVEYCQSWIDHFNKIDEAGMSYSRTQASDDKVRPAHVNNDKMFDMTNSSFYANEELRVECKHFDFGFWKVCYPLYAEKYSILQIAAPHKIYSMKVQKTPPGGGYHVWHFEDDNRQNSMRILTFILYLNDIEDGGETEFLYLRKRIKPKMGRLVLWPAGFTHAHRGNPPLADTKYIITGWVEF